MHKTVSGEIARGQENATERFDWVDVYLDEYGGFFVRHQLWGRGWRMLIADWGSKHKKQTYPGYDHDERIVQARLGGLMGFST